MPGGLCDSDRSVVGGSSRSTHGRSLHWQSLAGRQRRGVCAAVRLPDLCLLCDLRSAPRNYRGWKIYAFLTAAVAVALSVAGVHRVLSLFVALLIANVVCVL